MAPCRQENRSGLFEFHHIGDRDRETAPVGGFFFELRAAKLGERVKLGATVILCGLPLRSDPPLLLEFVQRWVQGAVTHLEDVPRDLFKAEADGVAVEGFEGQNLQEEKVESALNQVGRSAHCFPSGVSSVTETKIYVLRSVSKGKLREGKTGATGANILKAKCAARSIS